MKVLKLNPGYAFSSSKRFPIDPETVVLGDEEIKKAIFIGSAVIDGSKHAAFWIPGTRQYFFQTGASHGIPFRTDI